MFESEFWAMFGHPSSSHHHHPPPEPPAFSSWTRQEDKVFETALVSFPEGSPDRWLRIAAQLPGKAPSDVLQHYRALLQDLQDIEAGRVPPPDYYEEEENDDEDGVPSRRQISFGSKAKEERKKGVPWTEEEHRRFLEGLERYGKGDWRSISRNAVVTRTPTQVASHAQKYFIRLNSMGKKEKKRGSIHDITKP